MTSPYQENPTITQPTVTGYGTESSSGSSRRSSAKDVRVEEPKRHPLTYLALLLSVIALILAGKALHDANDDNGHNSVRVGNQTCVAVNGNDHGPAGLYCPVDGITH